jgi:hypothetical protein
VVLADDLDVHAARGHPGLDVFEPGEGGVGEPSRRLPDRVEDPLPGGVVEPGQRPPFLLAGGPLGELVPVADLLGQLFRRSASPDSTSCLRSVPLGSLVPMFRQAASASAGLTSWVRP